MKRTLAYSYLPLWGFILAATYSGKSLAGTNDIGLINAKASTADVIYAEGDQVFLKSCVPLVAPPVSRSCASTKPPKLITMDEYIGRLPYDVGAYERNDRGLAAASKILADAEEALAQGDQRAQATVDLLTPIKANLEFILNIRSALEHDNIVTYYDYQEAFTLLATPFKKANPHRAMTFIKVPKGTFTMGSAPSPLGGLRHESTGPSDPLSEDLRQVTIASDFFLQTTEVTQQQWYEVMGNNPSFFKKPSNCPNDFRQVGAVSLCANLPVENVSWKDTRLFIKKLNERQDGYRYRLPTEAEWEYATRGGIHDPDADWTGPWKAIDMAWFKTNTDSTKPVGLLKPNNWGLYDVMGNVAEWTETGPGDGRAYVRGGAFDACEPVYYGICIPTALRSATRQLEKADYRDKTIGFRLARVPAK